jgi:hypothetical protein
MEVYGTDMSAKAKAADEVANEIVAENTQVANATAAWDDCDLAAIVENDTDVAPVTSQGAVIEVNDFDAAPYVLFKVNLR